MMMLFGWKIYGGLVFDLANCLKITQTKKKIVKNLRDDSKMVDFASDGKTGPGSAQECRIYFAQKLHYTLHLSPQGTLRKTTDRLRIGFAQKET